MAVTGTASMTINEMREFANFSAAEQRYIKRSLDIGLGRRQAGPEPDGMQVGAVGEVEDRVFQFVLQGEQPVRDGGPAVFHFPWKMAV